jgi:hypothetical protein
MGEVCSRNIDNTFECERMFQRNIEKFWANEPCDIVECSIIDNNYYLLKLKRLMKNISQ